MSIASIPHLLSTEVVTYVSSTQTNLNLQTLFGSSIYSAGVNKKVIINSGVTIGATNTSNYALNIPSGFKGRIVVVNNGSIQGAGGAANGGTGGNAIFAGDTNIFIDNRGTIYSGGGGGGQGGTGGQGYYNYDCSYTSCGSGSGFWCGSPYDPDPWTTACKNQNGPTSYCINPNGNIYCCEYDQDGYCITPSYACCNCCTYISQTCTAYTSGGSGGSGGVGQGYNQSAASGSAGSAGGTNAGTGGTGGTGGSFGSSGNNGGTGSNGNYTAGSAGASGGLAGFYIVNNGNVTWINNGTRAGRVG